MRQKKELYRFYRLEQEHYYPGRIAHQLYLVMAVHLMMGSREFLEALRFMNREIQACPPLQGKKIMWVHLLPYYQETLRQYFDCNEKYQIFISDIVLDHMGRMDPEDPYRSIAKKLIRNVFNGSYEHKAQFLGRLAETDRPDAVIHFCHWGCKQADGGSVLLKEEMNRRDIPMLILDGDCIDQRNSHDGQIKTRLEAFLEMLDA